MPKATITSKTGAVITVHGSAEEVKDILTVFEQTTTQGHRTVTSPRPKVHRQEDKKRMGASDLVIDLKKSGFFEQPKGLGEISKKLEEQGYLYPTTSLSGIVLGLVQKRILRRKKHAGKWVYGK